MGRRKPVGGSLHDLARAINAEPWEPLPGHRKYQCDTCEFFFASATARETCHTCEEQERGRQAKAERLAREAKRLAVQYADV